MTSSRLRRALPIAALALSAAIGITALPAAAAAPPAAAPSAVGIGPTTSVTVFLKAPDAAALDALAAQPITDRATRMQQLSTLVPGQTQHQDAVSALTTAGFAVTHQTSWSITATAPKSVVTSLFGTPASGLTALPQLPGALTGLANTAYLTTGGTPLMHPTATSTLTGPDVRHADTPAGATSSTGGNDGALTIATLQLADLNPTNPNNASDLTKYASQNNIPDPVAGGRYHPVRVDGGPTAQDNAGEGNIEVALDQESILSTAPTASQQPYFAPNTTAGFNDVFASAYDDVTANAMATRPNPHLAAMSVSWGACEAAFGTAADIQTTQSVIASLVAAGVNIFAASGDDGIYDCRSTSGTGLDNSQEDVDFPASSPNVVAVGGTNLVAPSGTEPTDSTTGTGGTSPVYDGSNWIEKSWTCTDAMSCQATNVPTVGTGGTGGGVSGSAYNTLQLTSLGVSDFRGFAKPAYQSQNITTGAFAAPTTRMVPDIAADGDPDTGFVVVTTGMNLQVGGTSLAAPLSAGQFTNTLGDAGITTGVGDIHPALYAAFEQTQTLLPTDPSRVFRDVTMGSNGDPMDVKASDAQQDPSVLAGTGYDTNTGLGGVLWPAVTPYLPAAVARSSGTAGTANSAKPSISARLAKRVVHRKHQHRHKQRTVQATWNVAAAAGNPVVSTLVTVRRGTKTVFTSTAGAGSKDLRRRHGHYTLTVTTIDASGARTVQTSTLRIRHKHRHHQRR